MTLGVLLAAALSLPSPSHAVRIAADAWPSLADPATVEAPQAGEKVWWWSEACPPARLTADALQVQCGTSRPVVIRVVDERGRNIATSRVIWGTAEMLADLPETMLPEATTSSDGTASLQVSLEQVFVRAAGPRFASWWQKIEPTQTAVSIRTTDAAALNTVLEIAGGTATRSILEIEPAAVAASATDVRSWAVAERGAIALLPLPRMPLRYTAWSDDAAPRTGVSTLSAFPRALALPRGGRIEGRLLGPKGALSDASVEALFHIPDTARGLRRRAHSDSNGRFAIKGVTTGHVQLTIRKLGFATVLRMVTVNGVANVDDILMRAARTVVARVADRNHHPIAGAEIHTGDGVHATSDASGTARLDGVSAAEDVKFEVRARSYRPATAIALAGAKAPVEVILSRGVHVVATVKPAGSGNVMIRNNGGQRIEAFDSGRIDLGGLEAGTLALEVRGTASMPLSVPQRTVAEDDEVDLGELVLPAGAGMTGRLVARATAAAVPNAHVRVLRRGASGPTAAFVMRDWVDTTSSDDGTFAVAGLQPGPQVMFVEASGYASRVVTAEISDDVPLDLGAVELDRGRELIVHCIPIRRCGSEAKLLLVGSDFPWASVTAAMQEGTAHVLPAASGTATLRLLSLKGQVIDERPVEISEQSDTTTIDVKLVSTTVSGLVVANGRPRSGGKVCLERAETSRTMPVFIESRTPEGQIADARWMNDAAEIQTADVDDRGRFTFPEARPGSYKATYRRDGIASPPMIVSVLEMERFDFTIDLPPGEIRGRVVDTKAVPVSRAIVEVRDASGQSQVVTTNLAGEFSMGGITAGHVVVRAVRGDREGRAEADIAPPQPAGVEIALQEEEKKSGEIAVNTPNGQPLAGAVVFLFAGAYPGVATTDASGVATFHQSDSFAASAAAYSPSYGWSWTTTPQAPIRMYASTGMLVISSQTRANVELITPSGMPLGSALSMLGVPTTAGPGNDLHLVGLPPGTYTLQAGTFRTFAEVRAGEPARVSLNASFERP